MKIFVSHSLKDQQLINDLKRKLEPLGIVLAIAEHHIDLKQTITSKIEQLISQSDIALFLLTQEGNNSNFVQQEIGYIKKCGKPSLIVVQKGYESKVTGFIYGHDHIIYDPTQPDTTLEKIKEVLLKYWRQVEQKMFRQLQQKIASNKIEAERKEKEAKIGFGILAGLLVLGLINSD